MKTKILTFIFLILNGFIMADEKRVIVCFGNSYTEGLGARPEESYPALLQKWLGGVEVINAGVSGETAEEGLERLEEDVLSRYPDLVIVEFGTNEAFRGYPLEHSLRYIEKIVQEIKTRGAKIVIVGTRFGDYQDNFEEGLKSIAQEYETGLILNVLEGILGNSELTSDAYHPNVQGYRIMAQRILPEVRKWSKD